MANTTREMQTREATKRKQSWKPPSLLPTPEAQDGYKFRWVRVGSRGSPDNRNVSKRFREGWEPVSAKDHPELQVMSERGSEFTDGVEIGGLLLCKTPVENVRQRNEHFNAVAQDQMASVDNNLYREQDPRMPTLRKESRSRTTFGSGG